MNFHRSMYKMQAVACNIRRSILDRAWQNVKQENVSNNDELH